MCNRKKNKLLTYYLQWRGLFFYFVADFRENEYNIESSFLLVYNKFAKPKALRI